jgi:peptidyl-prolyl isomerase D
MDIAMGGEPAGKLVFELYREQVPKTVANFMKLCTGENMEKREAEGSMVPHGSPKPLTYTGSAFHRCVKGFMIQGGDFTRGNGTGGWSIYGEHFADENLHHKYTFGEPWRLGMANLGPDSNSSQFFVTCVPSPHLDGTHMVSS